MSEKDIYPHYGALNDITRPFVHKRIDLQNTDITKILKNIVTQNYTPNAIFGTGPYKAIVLRIEGSNKSPPIVGSWAERFWKNLSSSPGKSIELVQIKARIPEIHAMLPIPEVLGDNGDHSIIDMYPTFLAQSDDVPRPEVGKLVWVDYGNKINFTDPIYIKPVETKGNVGLTGIGKVSGKSYHQAACAGVLRSFAPSGDIISAKNKSLSHSGLPLLSRGTIAIISAEYKFVKGNRFSAEKLDKWQTAIQNKGVPGITWIGNLPSNGLEDDQHPAGIRNTIIYAPNTSDFSQPIELMYFFHGLAEFGNNHDFDGRFAPVIKKLSAVGRNFILVIPELPWAVNTKNPQRRSWLDMAWTGRDSFANFHSEVLFTIKEVFSSKLNINYISITAHSAGGGAAKTAAKNGFEIVKPNKITFADGSYATYAHTVWEQYVGKNPDVELNLLVQTQGAPNKWAKDLMKKIASQNKNVYYEEIIGKNHQQIGDLGLAFVNPKVQEKGQQNMLAANKNLKPQTDDDINKQEPMKNEEVNQQKKAFGMILPEQGNKKVPPPLNDDISPGAISKSSGTLKQTAAIVPAVLFEEARVRVKDYGSLLGNENILVFVPSIVGKEERLHKLVVKRFYLLNDKWIKNNPGSQDILAASGWRKHKWNSQAEYEAYLIQKFGSVQEGTKWVAFDSPHETGLAIDIGSNGIFPNKETNEQQKQTKLYKWLRENAHLFGFTPYKFEAWHWECRLPRESWVSGEEFTDRLALRIEHPGEGNIMPKSSGSNINCVTQVGTIVNSGEKESNLTGIGTNNPGILSKDKKRKLIEELAEQLGIEPELAQAFFTVESGGRSGFCDSGLPLIRFEPHVFADPKRMKQFNVLSNQIPWTGNSSEERKRKWTELGKEKGWGHSSNCKGQSFEFKALEYAKTINEELAYQSISVGIAQVMGFNHNMFGFSSAKQMYQSFASSEEAQIKAFFVYVSKRQGMLEATRSKDFMKMALLYNGKGQEQLYASKIKNYFEQFAKNDNKGTAVV